MVLGVYRVIGEHQLHCSFQVQGTTANGGLSYSENNLLVVE